VSGTVEQLWTRYERAGLRRLSPYTRTGYRTVYALRVRPHLGDLEVSKLTVGVVEDWLADLAAEELAWSTVRNARTVLAAMLTFAARREEDGVTLPHVARRAELPTQEPVRHLAIPPAELVAAVLRDLRSSDPELWLFECLAAITGARRGEVAALRVDDVHDDGVVIDEAVRSERKGGVVVHELGPTKTRARRFVPVDGDTLDAARAWITQRRLRARDLLFGFGEEPASPDIWSKRWRRACAEHGISTTQHGLRHLAATITAEEFGVLAAQARLGHSRVTTTERYVHQRPAYGVQAAAAIASALSLGD
jgi:integrase